MYCGACAGRLSKCPLCRTRITAVRSRTAQEPPRAPLRRAPCPHFRDPSKRCDDPRCGVELGPPFPLEPDEERDAARARSRKLPFKAAEQLATLCGAACTSAFCGAADPRARFDWLVVDAARRDDEAERVLWRFNDIRTTCIRLLVEPQANHFVRRGHAHRHGLGLQFCNRTPFTSRSISSTPCIAPPMPHSRVA